VSGSVGVETENKLIKKRTSQKRILLSKPTIMMDDLKAMVPPQIYITRLVDYSAKYGVGYTLSNQDSGVLFNDNSKISAAKDSKKLLIMYRKDTKEVCETFDEDSAPP
jgi:hypothetical protein